MKPNKCTICSALDWQHGRFVQVKFAVPKEESILKDYTGGYIFYRYLCPKCALEVNRITNQFPQELKAKK
jgi:hypothetical protein